MNKNLYYKIVASMANVELWIVEESCKFRY